MLWVHAVQVSAVSSPGKNGLLFIDWDSKRFSVEVALPRKALGVPVLDDMRLPHSAVSATNARLWVVHFDAPNMPATVTYSFVLFHRISVAVRLEPLRFDSKGRTLEVSSRERRLGVGRLVFRAGKSSPGCVVLRSSFFP